MTKSATRETADIAGVVGRKNRIINGNFDIWQRGTSQTASGYGSADRWHNALAGSTQVVSRQAFTLGQTDVPNNPKYYSRMVVTSVAGAGNLAIKFQKIEGVETFAGTTATISFWAKADANKNIAVELVQAFGSGGTNPSPSAIAPVAPTTVSLTTSWVKHTVSVAVPSIANKVLGTDGNDFLQLLFWMDAGSTYNTRTNSLGQQSGTFEFSQVQMEAGSVATEFEPRSVGEELALCQRYYQDSGVISYQVLARFSAGAGRALAWWTWNVPLRGAPTVTTNATWDTTSGFAGVPTFGSATTRGCYLGAASSNAVANGIQYLNGGIIYASAEL